MAPAAATITSLSHAPQSTPERIFRVSEIASEWKLSIDTVQRLFANEPDVFVIQFSRAESAR
jgi:hypothetical protein